jgi:hypothetical protein
LSIKQTWKKAVKKIQVSCLTKYVKNNSNIYAVFFDTACQLGEKKEAINHSFSLSFFKFCSFLYFTHWLLFQLVYSSEKKKPS